MYGSWIDGLSPIEALFQWGYGDFGESTSSVNSNDSSGSYNRSPSVDLDKTIKFRAKVIDGFGTALGSSSGSFKTYANTPGSNTPNVSNITKNSADVSCGFDAAVVDSTFSVRLQYRRFGDASWIDIGVAETSGGAISRALTGLLSSTTYQVQLSGTRTTANSTTWTSNIVSFDTLADPLTITTNAATAISADQVTLNGAVTPDDTAVRVRFGWGTSDGGAVPGSWANLTTYQSMSGSGSQTFGQLITSLSPLTQYFFRAFVEWPSPGYANSNSGVTLNFTTSSTVPTVATNAATAVGATQGRLNSTVNPNTQVGRVRFGWGTSDGGAVAGSWANLTSYQDFSGSGDQSFSALLTGLSATTQYFFRVFIEYPSPGFGTSASGSTLNFTTATDPLAFAALEAHMHFPQYDAHWGVAQTFYFCLSSPAGTSSDRLVTTAPGSLFATGDVKTSKDGAALANYTVANITQVTAALPLYGLPLVAADLQAEQVLIVIKDQDGPAFRDLYILIRTKVRYGQLLVNASQIGSSAPAMTLQPSSGGYSLDAQDSAGTNIGKIRGFLESMSLRAGTAQAGGAATITLDTSASATNDYYNGDMLMIVGGVGAGQTRVITDYDGSTKVATVNASWSTNPDSTSRYVIGPGSRTLDLTLPELASIPAAGGAAGLKLQYCFQRFAFKVTQTATIQTLFNSSGVSLGTRSVADDGTTQSIEKVV